MDVLDRNNNSDSVFEVLEIIDRTLKEVCFDLALLLFLTGAGFYGYVVLYTFQGDLLLSFGSLWMLLWLAVTPHNSETGEKRMAIFAGFALLTGVSFLLTGDLAVTINPIILVTALIWTSVVFVCFTFGLLCNKRRSYLFLGVTLMSGLSLLSLIALMNNGAVMMFKAHMYLGLIIMCGFVEFETQPIDEVAESGDRNCFGHCVDLFMEFIGLHHHGQESDGHPRVGPRGQEEGEEVNDV